MKMTALAVTLGVGAAVGAVALMMTPRECTARQLANKAACKVEGIVSDAADKLNRELGL